MPAIQPTQLRAKVRSLVDRFSDPPTFLRHLHILLEQYADHTYRPGKTITSAPSTLHSYNTHPAVLREILLQLQPQATAATEQTLALCSSLWSDSWLEPRLLALDLLGRIPLTHKKQVLDQLHQWMTHEVEPLLLERLITSGLHTIRQTSPDDVLKFVSGCLTSEGHLSRWGLRALLPLIETGKDEHIPRLFHLLGPLVRNIPDALLPELVDLMRALIHQAPQETIQFLRQCYRQTDRRQPLARLIRLCQEDLPTENSPLHSLLAEIAA